MHACEVHAHEMHARKVHAHETPAHHCFSGSLAQTVVDRDLWGWSLLNAVSLSASVATATLGLWGSGFVGSLLGTNPFGSIPPYIW